MSGGRWAAHRPWRLTSSLSGSVIRCERLAALRRAPLLGERLEGDDLVADEPLHPVQLLLEFRIGLEVPCHGRDPTTRPLTGLSPARRVPSLDRTMALPQPPIPADRHVLPPPRPGGRPALHALRTAGVHRVPRPGRRRQPLRRVRQGGPARRATRARYWSARQPTLVTYALISINVGLFIWLALLDPDTLTGSDGITGRSPDELGQWDLGLAAPFLENGEWYRLVTSGFLHFGIIHLAFNMLLLFQLGQLLEPAIGRIRFGLLYFAALLGGSAGALLVQPNAFHGGASGAVFGLMGAAFVGMRNRGVNPFSHRPRHGAADQPADHVHHPGHLDRRPHRRHRRRRRSPGGSCSRRRTSGSRRGRPTPRPVAVIVLSVLVSVVVVKSLTQHGHRRRAVGAAEQDGVHEQRGQLVPRRPGRASRRPAGTPRRRRRTRPRRSRRTAASSPGRPRDAPSRRPGRSASCAPAASTRRLPAHRSPCRSAGGSGGPHRSSARARGLLDERRAPGVEPAELDGPAGQRPQAALDEELGPVVGRREVDGLRAEVARRRSRRARRSADR